jgi:hypothetical protein
MPTTAQVGSRVGFMVGMFRYTRYVPPSPRHVVYAVYAVVSAVSAASDILLWCLAGG